MKKFSPPPFPVEDALKGQYYTYCVIAEEVTSHNPTTLDGILHEDWGWSLGEFERPEKLAQKFANELGKKVYLAKRSSGGGMYGYIQPNTVSTLPVEQTSP